jgi:hypothetical protein
MKSILIFVTAAALSPGSTEAFATPPPASNAARPSTTSLSMSGDGNPGKTFAASALAAAYLFAGVVSSPAGAAHAADYDDALHSSFADSSSVVVSARSGGRAGGRATPRAMPRPSSTTVINHRTIIAAPPVVMGGGYGYGGYGGGYGGYGYDPTPGIVFGAVNAIGNGMRESRQNDMIYQERAELGAAREREAEMASRIRQLEMMQMQQAGGGGGQQPQIIIAQPPAMQLAPAK